MGILSRMRLRAQAKAQSFTLLDHNALAQPTAAGKTVTEEASLRVSAAWRCMRIIAESIGALPWHVYARDAEGNAERADDHELADILQRSPNVDQTPVEFREGIAMNLAGHGN